MEPDDILKEDELEGDAPLDELEIDGKKKDLLDEEVESADDLAEEELDEPEEPFDDVNPI